MTSLYCRVLIESDLPQVLSLDQACFQGLWSEAGYRREIDSPNSDLLGLKIDQAFESAEQLIGVGCLWAILEEAHITLLGIAPNYRDQGLGQWLLLCLLQSARDRGLTHATLEVRASNQPAQKLYEKYGFKVAGERRRYYQDGETALILWRGGLQVAAFDVALQTWTTSLVEKLKCRGWQVPGHSINTCVM
ncbi:MAG: ribosomal protein S18-alanine N-acetyltransferase [Leptolyngbya sp. SIO1D8]|nr:ribosomal protein S18-alanine N-acetyltransferase [Leptolyngbya sp. SIO1D8]